MYVEISDGNKNNKYISTGAFQNFSSDCVYNNLMKSSAKLPC